MENRGFAPEPGTLPEAFKAMWLNHQDLVLKVWAQTTYKNKMWLSHIYWKFDLLAAKTVMCYKFKVSRSISISTPCEQDWAKVGANEMSRVFIFPHKTFIKSLPLCSVQFSLTYIWNGHRKRSVCFHGPEIVYFTSTDFLETKWGCQ